MGSFTPLRNLYKPAINELDWGEEMNSNLDILDAVAFTEDIISFLISSEIVDLVYPVGSVYLSTNSADPSTLFAGTTWDEFAQGKVLVGQDTLDTDFDTLLEEGGEKSHVIVTSEMPSHTHSAPAISGVALSLAGVVDVDTVVDDVTGSTGGDQPHNNLQPYVVVKIWRRLT